MVIGQRNNVYGLVWTYFKNIYIKYDLIIWFLISDKIYQMKRLECKDNFSTIAWERISDKKHEEKYL